MNIPLVDLKAQYKVIKDDIHQAIDAGQNVRNLTFQLAKRLEYGLRLVKDRVGKEDFIINSEALTHMESFINDLMKKAYQSEGPPDQEKSEE